jgi:hypothetical protein
MDKNEKLFQKTEKSVTKKEETQTVFHIVRKGKELELQELEIPKKDYKIVKKKNLKMSFPEQMYYLKEFFVDLLLKL